MTNGFADAVILKSNHVSSVCDGGVYWTIEDTLYTMATKGKLSRHLSGR